MNPLKLYKIANEANRKKAEAFVEAMLPELEVMMEAKAKEGEFTLVIDNNCVLAKTGLLENRVACDVLKTTLEKYKFQVEINDDHLTGRVIEIQWQVIDSFLEGDMLELEVMETGEEARYKNNLQLQYMEFLCEEPIRFYRNSERQGPSIEVDIPKEFVPSQIESQLYDIFRNEEFEEDMLEINSFDLGLNGINQLEIMLNLKLFTAIEIRMFMQILKSLLDPYLCKARNKCAL